MIPSSRRRQGKVASAKVGTPRGLAVLELPGEGAGMGRQCLQVVLALQAFPGAADRLEHALLAAPWTATISDPQEGLRRDPKGLRSCFIRERCGASED